VAGKDLTVQEEVDFYIYPLSVIPVLDTGIQGSVFIAGTLPLCVSPIIVLIIGRLKGLLFC